MTDKIVLMEHITKTFPGVKALDDCYFDLYKGEVHALIGENGAGKSTLMKILAGIYQRDSGNVLVHDESVNLRSPSEAQAHGIGIIHQELNLMQHLSVAENIFIGREPMKGPFIDKAKMQRETLELLQSLELNILPSTIVGTLTVAKQQMVEIAKALSLNSEVLIMDEPTAALTETEIQELFRFIQTLKSNGHAIVYISHRMEELFLVSDRITVMRDGEYIDTLQTSQTDVSQIIHLMVGRTIYESPKTSAKISNSTPVVLDVEHLYGGIVKDVSFNLRQGEILGFAGLMGAGRTETARLIFGADQRTAGNIAVNGQPVNIRSPKNAIKEGIGYLSEDRKHYGLATGLSVTKNTTLADLNSFSPFGFINSSKELATTLEYIDKLQIKTPSPAQLVRFLSGGNQQKVVIAKWLVRNCDILIFDEPTRGIDVGAKSEIYKLMAELTAEGKSIIMISSEMPELLRMSDRILIMCEGRVTGELNVDEEITQEQIMVFATTRSSANHATM